VETQKDKQRMTNHNI